MAAAPIESVVPPAATTQPSVRLIFAALLLVMLLAALDSTIVSTALPTIVGEFGALEHLSWIVTAYMLAQTVAISIYGKLGDLFGRKLMLQSSIVIFLVGSGLCGLSSSMPELIAFRAVQGIGGGGLSVLTMAVVADIVPLREAGRFQGYVGAVFGLATVLGPLIGGFFVEHLSWRWIFYVNLPLGLLSLGIIAIAFKAPAMRRQRPSIDFLGAALMTIMLTALVLLTSLDGSSHTWNSPASLTLLALVVVPLIAFVAVEMRAAEPILPPRLFANPTFLIACVVGFIVGLAMFGSITFLPVYLQVVKGVNPAVAGLQLMPMTGGVLLTSILSGVFTSRFGRYRILPIAGTALMTLSFGLLATLGLTSAAWEAPVYALLLGLGIGMVMQVLVIAAQNAVEYRDLGTATSAAALFRMIGGSVGVSLFGAIFAANLAAGLATRLPAGLNLPPATDAAAIAALPAAIRQDYLGVFTAALQPVFLAATAITALAFVLTWLLKETLLHEALRTETIGESFAMPHDETSLQELEAILSRMGHREHRWETYRRIANRAGVTLAPDEMWLLAQLSLAAAPLFVSDLAVRFSVSPEQIDELAARLAAQGLVVLQSEGSVTVLDAGRQIHERVVSGYRDAAARYLERWSPDEHAEVRAMLARLARELVADLPIESRRPVT